MIHLSLGFCSEQILESTLMSKDAEAMEAEGKQFKRLGKCRSKSKLDYPLDCGADADADQSGQGMSSLREEKVSSLRTVSLFLHNLVSIMPIYLCHFLISSTCIILRLCL